MIFPKKEPLRQPEALNKIESNEKKLLGSIYEGLTHVQQKELAKDFKNPRIAW